MEKKKVRIITHSAGFHADDVFAVATLLMYLGDDADVEIIRTRDPEIIKTGDYVVDVGNEYDPERNRFDHHQEGGAGERENKIPYAAFGLVWKKFGVRVAGSVESAEILDKNLVQQIDSRDNGVTLYELSHASKIKPSNAGGVFTSFRPFRGEDKTQDAGFLEAVAFARSYIHRLILHARADSVSAKIILNAYESSGDKRLIVVDEGLPISRTLIAKVLSEFPEPLFFVRKHEDGTWQLVCVNEPENLFSRRKDLPEAWAGKRGEELAQITGVADSIFCHNKRFMAVAKTKEGALALVYKALEA